jgi:hypothetical protein
MKTRLSRKRKYFARYTWSLRNSSMHGEDGKTLTSFQNT